MADVIRRFLSTVFQSSWESGEVPVDCKLANIVPSFKKGRSVSFIHAPDKITEKIILWFCEKHLEDNAVISHSQHRFTKGKSHLTNLSSLYDKITHLVNQGKPVHVVVLFIFCSDFSKAFGTVSPSILPDKISSIQLEKYTIWWVNNMMGEQYDGWWVRLKMLQDYFWPRANCVLQGSILRLFLFSVFRNELDAGVNAHWVSLQIFN